jgi:hypothetical protein
MKIKNIPEGEKVAGVRIARFKQVPDNHYVHFFTNRYNRSTHFYKLPQGYICTSDNVDRFKLDPTGAERFRSNPWVLYSPRSFGSNCHDLVFEIRHRENFEEQYHNPEDL